MLLSYSDNQKTRFFTARNFSEKPVELVYRIYYNSTEENGRDRTEYENTYKGQLYEAAVKAGVMNGALKSYIKTSDYKEENLLYIAGKINGASGTDPAKNNPSKPKSFNIAIAVAAIVIIAIWAIHDFASIHQ
ncbi:MAG TPA: hypothetical protein VIM16_04855 [Mucilaginibacter sp.]